MTLPTSYSWSPVGTPVRVDYEAPQGRRVNGIGAYFTHGPRGGRFLSRDLCPLPLPKGLRPEAAHQLAQAARADAGTAARDLPAAAGWPPSASRRSAGTRSPTSGSSMGRSWSLSLEDRRPPGRGARGAGAGNARCTWCWTTTACITGKRCRRRKPP